MKLFILFIAIVVQAFSSESIGKEGDPEVFPVATIVTIEGKAKILPTYSIKKHRAKAGEGLLKGDKLITYANTTVLIKLLDESKIILNENVEMVLSSDTTIRQESGEVYYRISKRTKNLGLKVETPFSIIGIKGTEFLVNFENEGQVALNEGLVDIASPGDNFELYQEKVLSDFEKYQQKQDADFEAYKRKTEDKIAAYVQSFELQSNKMLRFSSPSDCKERCEKRVEEVSFTEEVTKRFKKYQEMAGQ